MVDAIKSVQARKGVAIVIAHRPSAVAAVDLILAMKNGEMVAFGPRDEVFGKILKNANNVVKHPATHASARADAVTVG